MGVFNQRFEALFPRTGALGCAVCFAPRRLSGLSVHECGVAGSASGQTACPVRPTLHQSQSRHSNASPLHSGAHLCPSCRLVWMYVSFLSTWCRTSLPFDFLSVLVVRGGTMCLPPPPSWFSGFILNFSSLTPWLSDFHTVQFSVSSGCFLFLNCCCSSFGCARRHTVSTYASILAGS